MAGATAPASHHSRAAFVRNEHGKIGLIRRANDAAVTSVKNDARAHRASALGETAGILFAPGIVGFAGALAALITWWVQSFAARRGFVVRFLFALFIFVVAFCSFGGLLRFIYIHATYPSQQDWSLSGLYWASQSDLISFVIFMLVPPRPAYAALIVAAAFYIALFGPREPKTVEI